jgi:hypothetical protein
MLTRDYASKIANTTLDFSSRAEIEAYRTDFWTTFYFPIFIGGENCFILSGKNFRIHLQMSFVTDRRCTPSFISKTLPSNFIGS